MIWLRNAAQRLFDGACLVAVWAYGGTTAWCIHLISSLLPAALLVWMTELVVNRRKPALPPFLLFLLAALLVIGGWMVWNAGAILDTDFSVFVATAKVIPRVPGSIDYAVSAAWMIRFALLSGAILFVA